MPAKRAFLAFGGVAVLLGLGVLRPVLIGIALSLDVLLLVAIVVDQRRARTVVVRARRTLPDVLVQGARARVVVRLEADRSASLIARDTLHPGVALTPVRAALRIARRPTTWSYDLVPRLRGEHRIGPLTVRVLGPWGLAWAQRDLIQPQSKRVYPQVRWEGKVGHLLRLADRRELGRSPLRVHGVGAEPYGLREYRPGDPPTRIHWKATARHGRLIAREDTWERGTRLVILLDCARAMTSADGSRSKLDYALAAALALTRVAVSRGDRVTIVGFSDRVERIVRLRSGRHAMVRAYRALYDLEARLCEPAYDLVVETVSEVEPRHARLMLLTSIVDLGAADLLREALVKLRRAYRPFLINLQDPDLHRLAMNAPRNPEEAFAKVASLGILLENRRLGRALRRAGVKVASAAAHELAWEVLSTYLGFQEHGTGGSRTPARL